MKLELLLDKPKFTLMFPYKNQFNRAGGTVHDIFICYDSLDSKASDSL
ncbi:hypothetical protein D8852_07435 [Streptococcus mitis]|uniref:Uncharacterized protein n=1 Tax=Streptococcus mitis TaxID=28037 RepID=A0A3R9KLT2_STRMT|nr:hypothetical protein D8852_07435 [Streptococcus mitis]RSJ07714.1 hypothetical protein D8839_06020 [Streptococcus mitis]